MSGVRRVICAICASQDCSPDARWSRGRLRNTSAEFSTRCSANDTARGEVLVPLRELHDDQYAGSVNPILQKSVLSTCSPEPRRTNLSASGRGRCCGPSACAMAAPARFGFLFRTITVLCFQNSSASSSQHDTDSNRFQICRLPQMQLLARLGAHCRAVASLARL